MTPLGRWCRDQRVAYHRLGSSVGIGRRRVIEIVTGNWRAGRLPNMTHLVLLSQATGLPIGDFLDNLTEPPNE